MSGDGFFMRMARVLLGEPVRMDAARRLHRRNNDPESNRLLEEFLDTHPHMDSGKLDLSASEAGKRIVALSGEGRLGLLFAAYEFAMTARPQRIGVTAIATMDFHWRKKTVRTLIGILMRKPMPFTQLDLAVLVDGLTGSSVKFSVPVGEILNAVARIKAKEGELIPELRGALSGAAGRMRARPERHRHAVHRRTQAAIADILNEGTMGQTTLNLSPGEAWSDAALSDLAQMTPELRNAWADLMVHAQGGDGSKPTKKWLGEASKLIERVGKEEFCSRLPEWFGHIGKKRTEELPAPGECMPDKNLLLTDEHADILKGLMWSCCGQDDVRLARAVGDAAVAAYKKVTWHGPMNKKVGNAAVVALSSMPGTEATAQLGRLNTSVKHKSAKKFLGRRIDDVAERTGQTKADLAEVAVPTFDLDAQGRRRVNVGEFTAEIAVTGSTDAELKWFRADGKEQKAVPVEVKRDHAAELKALQRTVKDIEKLLPAQRIRIERLLMGRRHWPMEAWRARFVDHPLVGNLSRRLIWEFHVGSGWASGALLDGKIMGADDQLVAVSDKLEVRLWHPIDAPAEEVAAWRGWLERHEITQPFKQAHREIYAVTDAERESVTYSNRFAAHILRQHQFAALCTARGWEYALMGAFDSHSVPTLRLPDEKMRVELWVDPANEDQRSGAGIFLYVATDQVRFYHDRGTEAARIEEISPLLFTEVMRDVDLFVGVASVGNDDTWRDAGQQPDLNAYWQRQSFGELGVSAQTRKAVLERLVPKLKHAERFSFTDRFLVVRGEIRTYKIHLGSANILMSPNDRYLCIVPARGVAGEKLFLPFEGDGTLSIILSKAMMLAEDRKIKDPSIRSQIGG